MINFIELTLEDSTKILVNTEQIMTIEKDLSGETDHTIVEFPNDLYIEVLEDYEFVKNLIFTSNICIPTTWVDSTLTIGDDYSVTTATKDCDINKVKITC